jgi:hypothetical protein
MKPPWGSTHSVVPVAVDGVFAGVLCIEDSQIVGLMNKALHDRSRAERCRINERTKMSGMPLLTPVLILLLLAVVGLFLSLLLGIPILIAALFVLSRRYDWARRLLAGGQQQFARIAREAQQLWRSVGIKGMPR